MEPITRTVKSWDTTKLFTQVIENGASCWVIATHGIGEHLGRHKYLKDVLGNDVNILQYDLRGHGKSQGEKAYVTNFDYFAKDLEFLISYLRDKYDAKKIILFGHSMGALITLGYIQSTRTHDDLIKGVVVNAPPLGFPGALGKVVDKLSQSIITKLASYKASIPLGGLVELAYLSHDKKIKEAYLKDELVLLKLHTKLLLEMVRYSKMVVSRPINSPVPLYCSYGSEDGIVSTQALEDYFSDIEEKASVFKVNGAYHEVHNEVERYREPYFEYLRETIRGLVFN